MPLPGHLGHRFGSADFAPMIEGIVSATAIVDDSSIVDQPGIIRRIAKEEVRTKLDFIMDRASQELADAQSRRLPHGIETRQFDRRVNRITELLDLAREHSVSKRTFAQNDVAAAQ